MAQGLRGVTVTLYEKTKTGVDDFGNPLYEEIPVDVDNVLVGEPSTDDITTSTAMYGKTISCVLGIPKGDTHNWMDSKVKWTDAYGQTFTLRTFGFPITGIEANIPLHWNKKVRCEAYG